jgi:hypothetical protein
MSAYAGPLEALGGIGGGILGGATTALGYLDKPRQWLWNALGLPDQGEDVLTNLGMDKDNPLTKILGMGLNVAGDPLTYAGGFLGKALGGLAGRGLEAAAAARGPEFATTVSELKNMAGEALPAMQKANEWSYAPPRSPSLSFTEALSSPYAQQIAKEVPPGSEFFGAGAEATALRTPQGTVVRIGKRVQPLSEAAEATMRARGMDPNAPSMQATQPDPLQIPEVLQPMRHVQIGPYQVTHSPLIQALSPQVDEMIAGMKEGGLRDVMDRIEQLNTRYEGAGARMAERLTGQGFRPWDVHEYNIGQTPEARWLVHDLGAIGDEPAGVSRLAPTLVRQPNPMVNAILSLLGSPGSIQQELARPSTIGQGISFGG